MDPCKDHAAEKAWYSGPGPDDTYLRPKSGQQCAPRQVSVCTQGRDALLSWVHYRGGEDHLVVARKGPNRPGKLVQLASGGRFSKPTFLSSPTGSAEVLCGISKSGKVAVHRYAQADDGWQLSETIPTRCEAAYYLDAASDPRGGAFLVYAGLVKGIAGLQVYSRVLKGCRWGDEQAHPFGEGSVNRPKLAVDAQGVVTVVADTYRNGRFCIVCKALSQEGGGDWEVVWEDEDWSLFPSVVGDTGGSLWISWLRQVLVRRQDVVGQQQEAMVSRRVEGRWQLVGDAAGQAVAHLDLGLLPVERYFGYAGLRRYPRLAACTDGSVWLLWEQQKGEEEIWENVHNGLLCGRRWHGGKWSRTFALMQEGACHAFDEKHCHLPQAFVVAAKGRHTPSGNDFRAVAVDLGRLRRYDPPSQGLWEGWKRPLGPLGGAKGSRGSAGGSVQADHRLFWGDPHCHSFFSPDAEGEPDELYLLARDVAQLDFVCIIDNDFYPWKSLLNSEVHYTARLAEALTREGEFICLWGYEWTFHRPDKDRAHNHRTVIFTGRDQQIIRRNEPRGSHEKRFREHVGESECLAFPHHAHWRLLGLPSECNVEVTSGWGTYILDAGTVHEALQAGHRFGFVGSSDSHRFLPGLSGALTGVYAAELSKPAIVEALRRRRCFATTGNRTAVGFWINGRPMGEEVRTECAPVLRWEVKPEGTLERIEIVRNGEVVWASSAETGTWRDEADFPPASWYYLRVKEKGEHRRYPHNIAPARGKWAWSSPIWVSRHA